MSFRLEYAALLPSVSFHLPLQRLLQAFPSRQSEPQDVFRSLHKATTTTISEGSIT